MTSFRAAFLAALCSILLSSCGDTFRPIAIPEPGTLPPVQASKTAQVVTDSGAPTGVVTNYNLSGGTVTGQAPVGQGPAAALLFGSRVYVANQTDNTLSVYNATSPQSPVPGTVTLVPDSSPQALAAAPSGSTIFVAYTALNAVGIVNTANNTAIGSIPLNANGFTGNGPAVMITNAGGTKLFVGNTGSNNISIIDIASGAVVATVGGCSHPIAMARTPDVAYVYVACRDSNNVLILNANTNVADYNVPVGASPVSATFDAASKRLIVTSSVANSVTFFEEDFSKPLASQHVQTIVPVGAAPVAAAPLPNGMKVFIANSGDGTVTVINSGDLTVNTSITVGGQPLGIVASSDSTRVAVTTTGPDVLQVVDTGTNAVNATHTLVGPAKALLVF